MRRYCRWLMTVLLLAGCAKPPAPVDSAPPNPGSAPETGKSYLIGMSQCNRGEPWRVQMDADVKDAAAQHPELELVMQDAQNDVKTQQAQVRDFISQGLDLILISPKEARPLAKPVSEAMAAGIPVIVLDRDIDGGDYTCFIGADNTKIGQAAGEYLVKLLGGKGKVVELKGLMTSTPGQDRHNGFMEGLKGSNLELVFDADCGWQEETAKAEMQSALTRFEDIDAVYGHNDPSAHGAWLAAKQEGKGREQAIKFIGIDALPHEGVRYVKEGLLSATFQYPTGGAEAIDTALKILAGQTVPKRLTLGTRSFTPENVEAGGEALD